MAAIAGRLSAEFVGSGSGQRRRVSQEILGDDLIGGAEVAIPQIFPLGGERGAGCVGHGGFPFSGHERGLRTDGPARLTASSFDPTGNDLAAPL